MTKLKILLAEDDEDDRMLFFDFIKDRHDLELVHSTENGMEIIPFLDRIESGADFPDLIVLDQNMPKLNGSQTLHLLKSNVKYAHIPVAIYTTYSDKRLVKESYDAGAVLVIEKPVSPSGYHQMMNEFIEMISSGVVQK